MMERNGFAPIPILLIVTAAVGIVGYFGFILLKAEIVAKKATMLGGDIVCTQEAIQCPDGSYIGRTGPNCEFAACPNTTSTAATRPASSTPQVLSLVSPQLNAPTSPTPNVAPWVSYINAKHLFGFKHPQRRIPYIAVDKENGIILPAGDGADRVFIAENEAEIFRGIPKTLAFEVVQEDVSNDDWLAGNMQKYIASLHAVSEKKISFAGRSAVEVIGDGTGGSAYKLIVVKPGSYSIAIAQSAKSDLLEKILESFTFNIASLR